MKNLALILLITLFSTFSYAQTISDKILGKWISQDKSITIEFVKKGTSYDAKIVKNEAADLVGKKLITGLKSVGNNAYSNGTLHLYKKKMEANLSAKLLSDKKLELKASNGFGSKKQVWTKL